MKVSKEEVDKARADYRKAGADYDAAKAYAIDDIDAAYKVVLGKYTKLRAAWNKYQKLRDEYENGKG